MAFNPTASRQSDLKHKWANFVGHRQGDGGGFRFASAAAGLPTNPPTLGVCGLLP